MHGNLSSIIAAETIETAFAHLEACLEQFLAQAPVAQVDQLVAAIPAISPENQRLILIELIKVDMAMAAELGVRRNVEFYLPQLQDRLPRDQVPLDLILEEVQLGRDAGESPCADVYVDRFPHLAVPLREILSSRSATATSVRLGRPPELELDAQIDDFKILSHLGSGAFARVYLAEQLSMRRLVALKVSVRAGEEPQALSQLDHPNVVRLYDQRQCHEPPVLLLYMQYLSGGTLADVIKLRNEKSIFDRNGQVMIESIDRNLLAARQPPPEASSIRAKIAGYDWPTLVAWIGVQLAQGLGYAHRKGVLHRDVKPANVLLTAEGLPKLADFNVSHSGVEGRAGAAAHFGGSLAYMSPEQLRVANVGDSFSADQLDGRSDLYGLAILLWELWQGTRPWATPASAESWGQAIGQQIAARDSDPNEPFRWGTASERVLERALRRTLNSDRDQRPRNGDELAGRLRLALYPDMAALFEPEPGSISDRLHRAPVLITAACCILIPNGAAGAFNWTYNLMLIQQEVPHLEEAFRYFADCVNLVAFPLGAALLVWFSLEVARALKRASQNLPADDQALDATWNLGTRAAQIGGLLWMICGLVYPIGLRCISSDFNWELALSFFVSLCVCGGVAWIYPFFGLSTIAAVVYYPRLVAPTMTDRNFTKRAIRLHKRMTIYLASAAVIPLLSLALLIMRHTDADGLQLGTFTITTRHLLLSTVSVTLLGLSLAFAAFQRMEHALRNMGQVLEDPTASGNESNLRA